MKTNDGMGLGAQSGPIVLVEFLERLLACMHGIRVDVGRLPCA